MAGVVISITIGENGLFNTTKNATTQYEKSALKEELEIAIANIQSEKYAKGEEISRENLYELSNIGATVETVEIPAEGEYKNYYFEIDENYHVTILDKIQGEKPTITAEIISTDLVTYAEIKITAEIKEGTIANIESNNGGTLKEDAENTNTTKTFIINEKGTYYFKATADNGRSAVTSVVVNLGSMPEIKITDVTPLGFNVIVEDNNEASIITEYKYYVNEELKSNGIKEKNYKISGLYEGTEYKVYVEACTEFGNIKSNIETATTGTVTKGIKLNGSTQITTNLAQSDIYANASGEYTIAMRVKINRAEQASVSYMGLFGLHIGAGNGISMQFAGTSTTLEYIDYTPYYDRWTDIVRTYNNGIVKWYYNGRLMNEVSASLIPCSSKLVIGNSYDSSFGRYMKGSIASVKVWSKELTENEVEELDMGQENTSIQTESLKLETMLDSLESIQEIGTLQGSNYKFLGNK